MACAVLNSKNELLVGERISTPDAWQAPQGGVDDAWEENNFEKETIGEAASRELYEEMGLQNNEHVLLLQDHKFSIDPVRYETTGTNNWLTKSGFSGQELHWTVFRVVCARGDSDASFMCDLEGKNGEAPEFSNVNWKPIDWVVENMWPKKRGPYETLQQSFESIKKDWHKKCQSIDFAGTWSRDSSLNENVEEGLIKRGVPPEKVKSEALGPYVQRFSREDEESMIWNIKTYDGDTATVRRDLNYQIGSWKESFSGRAVLFGDVTDGLDRTSKFIAEPDSDSKLSLVTITALPGKGIEESRRYLKDDQLILKRIFWPEQDVDGIQSKEVFTRVADV